MVTTALHFDTILPPPVYRTDGGDRVIVVPESEALLGMELEETTVAVRVDPVDFEALGVVGESGCGKSTLARTIVGIVPPTSGEIVYRGSDIASLKGRERREIYKHIQFVFQDPTSSLNPRKTVREILAAPMIQLLGLDKHEAERGAHALMDKVNMRPEFLDRHPYTNVLLASIPHPDQHETTSIRLSGDLPNPADPPPGCPFQPRCYRATSQCAQSKPPLTDYGSGHKAACFYAHHPEPPSPAPLGSETVAETAEARG